jgi:DNA-binding transcriptional ArsR family regulator
MNVSFSKHMEENISRLFSIIGQPVRIQILMVIAGQEACVCHLETVLGMRQASISQHLMVLRKAGLVTTHRDGRNIYYKLQQPDVIAILEQAARLLGSNPKDLQSLSIRPIPDCPCPQCNPDLDPKLSCQNNPVTQSS